MTPTISASRTPPPIRVKPSRFRCTPLVTSRLPNGGCLSKASAAGRRGIIGRLKIDSDYNGVTAGRTIRPHHTPRQGENGYRRARDRAFRPRRPGIRNQESGRRGFDANPAVAQGVDDRFGTIVDFELAQDRADVIFNGLIADAQLATD